MKKNFVFFLLIFWAFSYASIAGQTNENNVSLSLWVPCESSNRTLDDPSKISDLIKYSKNNGIRRIYLQVYRGNRSWYKSKIADSTPFENCQKIHNVDPLKYSIKKAHENNIELHAWINVLRIARNTNAPILEELGENIITRDNKGRSLMSMKAGLPEPENKYYHLDYALWLEPGDPVVQTYIYRIVKEMLDNYPEIDGLHLDFIRYPFCNPYSAGSYSHGISFGYGTESTEAFHKATGLDPIAMKLTRKNGQAWDDWRRGSVTAVVKKISRLCKGINRNCKLSVAALPWGTRAYLSAFQDWQGWLEEGIIDFAVVMNYTIDLKLFRHITKASMAFGGQEKIHMGIGAYMLSDDPALFSEQISEAFDLKAREITIFSYDSILNNQGIRNEIRKTRKKEKTD
ncbi:MAG: family 10 glycosylhydrolase [Candidatus Theseobacter exili]|nr:family 10 glycosylhydrolase [Candidatus Theseobacter exili]